MKSKVQDTRKFVLTALAALVGLIIFILFIPSIGGSSAYMYVLFSGLIWTIPLLVIGLLLIALSGKKHTTKEYGKKLNKYLSDSIVLGIVFSFIFSLLSYSQPLYEAGTSRYIYENLGAFFIYFSSVLLIVLTTRQNFMYWPFWNKFDRSSADEREMAVRNRVFEKSYRISLVLLGIIVWFNNSVHGSLPTMRLVLIMTICLLATPAIIASKYKDS